MGGNTEIHSESQCYLSFEVCGLSSLTKEGMASVAKSFKQCCSKYIIVALAKGFLMTLVKVAIVLALALVFVDVDAQTQFNTRAVVERLASDEFEGRLTGSDGIRKAADYIEEQFARIGIEPLPGVDGFRQDFSYTAGVTDMGTVLTVRGVDGAEVGDGNVDMAAVRALSFSDVGTADGPLVFAGYGLSVPETDGFSYDS